MASVPVGIVVLLVAMAVFVITMWSLAFRNFRRAHDFVRSSADEQGYQVRHAIFIGGGPANLAFLPGQHSWHFFFWVTATDTEGRRWTGLGRVRVKEFHGPDGSPVRFSWWRSGPRLRELRRGR